MAVSVPVMGRGNADPPFAPATLAAEDLVEQGGVANGIGKSIDVRADRASV